MKIKAFDFWSIIHFLLGIVFAFIFLIINFPFWISLIIFLMIAIIWEIIEKVFDKEFYNVALKETIWNHITDVVFSALGFLISWKILSSF